MRTPITFTVVFFAGACLPPTGYQPGTAPSTPAPVEEAAAPADVAPDSLLPETPAPTTPTTPTTPALPPNPPLPVKFGLLLQPRLGDVFNENGSRAPITFSGLHPKAAQAIDVQILSSPTDLASWITIATATTGATPEPGTELDPLYPWTVQAIPGADVARWPSGGLVRVRAMAGPERLVGLYHDADACFAAVTGGIREKARACASDFLAGVILSSSARSPVNAQQPPRYLRETDTLSDNETNAYYTAINAPETLVDFRARYGFDRAGSDEARARYYNRGDLGIGRDMRCVTASATRVACYVENFGEFGGRESDALDLLQNGDPFATVAMVYDAPITSDNAVKFMVYGATGALALNAQLDTRGDNISIPTNCMNCHGGSGTYERTTHTVRNARFLPFDPSAFGFADRNGLRAADQEEPLRKLNKVILGSEPTIAMRLVVEGSYGGAAGLATANTVSNPKFVPTTWGESTATAHVYQQVVGPYCRSCHESQQKLPTAQDILDFGSSAVFIAQANNLVKVVCGTAGDARSHTMPNAEATVDAFWRGPARAYLVAYLGAATSCAP